MLLRFVLLFIVFIALQGGLGLLILARASFFAAVVAMVSCKFITTKKHSHNFASSAKLVPYILWLLKEIFVSALGIIKIIVFVKSKNIRPIIRDVEGIKDSEVADVIYANSITLTPGTITIHAGDKLKVHSISQSHHKDLSSGDMREKIRGTQL